MRRFKRLILAMLVLGTAVSAVFLHLLLTLRHTQYPEASHLYYVEDYSGVFSEKTERYLLDQASALQGNTRAQLVVVAVPDTQLDSGEKFSRRLFETWRIGGEREENGALILFTTDRPSVRVEVGRGLRDQLTESKVNSILSYYAREALEGRRWNEAARNIFVAAAREIYRAGGGRVPEQLQTVQTTQEMAECSTLADLPFPEPVELTTNSPFVVYLTAFLLVFWMVGWVIALSISKMPDPRDAFRKAASGPSWRFGGDR